MGRKHRLEVDFILADAGFADWFHAITNPLTIKGPPAHRGRAFASFTLMR